MSFIKDFFDILGKFNIEYTRDSKGDQNLNVDINDGDGVGGEISMKFGNKKKPEITAYIGSKKEEIIERE